VEPETDQKIRENRKLQKKAVSKDSPREAQKSGDRTDTADHVGDIFSFHKETLIQIAPPWQFPFPFFPTSNQLQAAQPPNQARVQAPSLLDQVSGRKYKVESAISPPTPNKPHHKQTPQSEPLNPATAPFSRPASSNVPRANSGSTPTTRSSPPDSFDPSDTHSKAHSTSHAPIIRELLPRAFPRPLFLKYYLPWTGSRPSKPSRP